MVPGREAGHAALDDEGRDAPVLLRPVERGEEEEMVGHVAQADPDLGAVEDVRVALATGCRLEVGRVRPDARLGKGEGRQLLALGLRHEEAPLLVLRAPLQERQRVQPDVDAHDHPEGRVRPLQLLAQEAQADVVHARTAVALGDRRAEEAQLAHLAEGGQGHLVTLVPLADVGQDLRLGEGADGLLDERVLGGQGEVDHGTARSFRSGGRVGPILGLP